MTATVAVAMMAVAILTLISPRPVHADHNSLEVKCPGPIREGESGKMRIKRDGYRVVSAVIFTHHGHYSAGPEDFEEYHGVKFKTKSGQKTLRVPLNTNEDSLPEHDETFAAGFMSDDGWRQCVVTIEDDDAPEITRVEIISQPVDGYAYRAGDSIDIAVELSAKADVAEGTMLSLFLGDGSDSTWRGAQYLSGSGSHSLVFRYRVKPEDLDLDGISVSSASVNDDHTPASGFTGSTYYAGTDVPIDYTHPGVKGGWRQKVDGRPYVQSARIISSPPDEWEAYRANQAIEMSMTFDTDVVVEGDVTIDLYLEYDSSRWDEVTRRAGYTRGSGTDTLVFGYTVRLGDTSPEGVGLFMGTETYGFGGSGAIRAKGTDVDRNPWYLGTGPQPEHRVDTDPPGISSVSITSTPTDGETYSVGATISIEVVFDEDVTPSGDVHLELDVGGEIRTANLGAVAEGAYGSSLTFEYTVQEGDTDMDGVGIAANSLRLNGGGIHDIAGNSAGLSHEAVAADSSQKVNASSLQ
jgi:hypothetical protein